MSFESEAARKGIDYQSQLGLQLRGFDQVVAISQQTINTVLKYRFATNSILRSTQTNASGLWTFDAPSVELVDAPNGGDGALLSVKLARPSSFNFVEGDGVTRSIAVAGSILVFALEFRLQRAESMPEDVAAEINDPGSYTVSQLILDFTGASLATFKAEKSKFTGFDSFPAIARDGFATAVAQYLKDLGASGQPSILGQTLTSIKPELARNQVSTSPPTSVKLQTMYYLPYDGTGTKNSESKNAFLFTEMCAGRAAPSIDLEWTGNWFCPPISGTMVVSKRVFYDEHLLPNLNTMNITDLNLLNDLSKQMAFYGPAIGVEWQITRNKSSIRNSPAHIYENDGASVWEGTHKTPWYSPDVDYRYTITSGISATVEYKAGFGKVSRRSECFVEHSCKFTVAEQGVTVSNRADVKSLVEIAFVSAKSGELRVETKVDKVDAGFRNDLQLNGLMRQVLDLIGSAVQQKITVGPDMSKYDQDARIALLQCLNKIDFGKKIENQLNGQQKFILAGGGTFAMKDPTFNHAGDLMIGLTYKLRAKDDTESLRKELGIS